MSTAFLLALIPTFFFVSVTPGMCMTLALTLGMTVGIRRTMWMMLGELIGVGLVAISVVIGVAALIVQYPELFVVLKIAGGGYLLYLGIQLWRSKGKMAIDLNGTPKNTGRLQLATQGFITAVANPKGWAFFIALLPPFIDPTRPMPSQMVVLLSVILTLEALSLMVYALGGKSLSKVLQKSGNVRLMNRIAGSLMMGVAAWLALG
ncbi:LysE family translocator [Oceanospirillaceae bacterium]|jgi:homoserine/homoserine lactone efflux protein|uniref:LysE family translocator n=1 Tax=Candidatus Njordibacter sp. Uisw_058 TaxID=3230974 RepID=UPI001EB6D42F|nr:LysE family translocator [Oceanospirillaceae bacterium]MDA7809758.1 LysE family translocator [bacterium]MBT4997467.1 LysE family translocator [Oceanospirillaceae bacterium]MBT5629432.1 LysE family translocator [Oceanospirillaceae bacterium]MBT6099912.1 LysE family translocator [Oceanospirillaceae bacterium]|tara:strand:- start:436 stop:1053 length:618 start_codon:yes stop_codon:yes gene_type:complete